MALNLPSLTPNPQLQPLNVAYEDSQKMGNMTNWAEYDLRDRQIKAQEKQSKWGNIINAVKLGLEGIETFDRLKNNELQRESTALQNTKLGLDIQSKRIEVDREQREADEDLKFMNDIKNYQDNQDYIGLGAYLQANSKIAQRHPDLTYGLINQIENYKPGTGDQLMRFLLPKQQEEIRQFNEEQGTRRYVANAALQGHQIQASAAREVAALNYQRGIDVENLKLQGKMIDQQTDMFKAMFGEVGGSSRSSNLGSIPKAMQNQQNMANNFNTSINNYVSTFSDNPTDAATLLSTIPSDSPIYAAGGYDTEAYKKIAEQMAASNQLVGITSIKEEMNKLTAMGVKFDGSKIEGLPVNSDYSEELVRDIYNKYNSGGEGENAGDDYYMVRLYDNTIDINTGLPKVNNLIMKKESAMSLKDAVGAYAQKQAFILKSTDDAQQRMELAQAMMNNIGMPEPMQNAAQLGFLSKQPLDVRNELLKRQQQQPVDVAALRDQLNRTTARAWANAGDDQETRDQILKMYDQKRQQLDTIERQQQQLTKVSAAKQNYKPKIGTNTVKEREVANTIVEAQRKYNAATDYDDREDIVDDFAKRVDNYNEKKNTIDITQAKQILNNLIPKVSPEAQASVKELVDNLQNYPTDAAGTTYEADGENYHQMIKDVLTQVLNEGDIRNLSNLEKKKYLENTEENRQMDSKDLTVLSDLKTTLNKKTPHKLLRGKISLEEYGTLGDKIRSLSVNTMAKLYDEIAKIASTDSPELRKAAKYESNIRQYNALGQSAPLNRLGRYFAGHDRVANFFDVLEEATLKDKEAVLKAIEKVTKDVGNPYSSKRTNK